MKRTTTLLTGLCLLVVSSFAQTNKAAQTLEDFQAGKYQLSDYNTACYFALDGKPATALLYLKKAIEDGFSDVKTIEEDSDLASLHSDSGWHKLVADVKGNVARNAAPKNAFYNKSDFWEPAVLKTPYSENMPEDDKIAGLSKLWSEAKYNFVNFDLIPALNWDSLYLSYLPQVRHTQSTLDYYKVLTRFYASLKDGHTNVYVPDELNNETYARPLLRTRLIEGKVLVVRVYDPALLNKGIQPGLEVTQINGMPVKQYAADSVMPYQSSSTPQDMDTRAYEYALLAGSLKQPIRLRLQSEKGNAKDYTIDRVTSEQRSKAIHTTPFTFTMLDGNIAYVALNAFDTDSAANAFDEQYSRIANASAIIFDVRDNGGGNTGVGWHILRYLIEKPMPVHKAYSREYIASYRAWEDTQKPWETSNKLYPNGKFLYTKPVIVLTSSRTFSAAEDFVAAFKSLHRGLIVGEPTGGSTGQPLFMHLPGGGTARVCTKRDQLANGDDFVGKGVQPDKVVRATIADVRKGTDTQLEAAVQILRKTK